MSSLRRLLTALHLIEPAAKVKHRAENLLDDGLAAAAARRGHQTPEPTFDPTDTLLSLWQQASSNWYYDVLTAAVIRRVLGPTDMAIDIGAHVGDVLRHMINAAPQGHHLAVEPLPHLAAALRADFPSVRVEEFALMAEPSGPTQFHHVSTNPGYSGLRQRSFDRPHEEVEIIDVQTARLDDLVGDDQSPALIKLDVEGAELGVLRGATRILEKNRPVIVFEHGLGAANHYETTPRAMYDLLTDLGYQIFLLGTWLEHGPDLTRDQFVDQFEQQRNYYFLAAPA